MAVETPVTCPATVRFQLLGPVVALGPDGTPVKLGAHKQRGVLVCLLLHANTVVSTRRLVADVWGDDAPPTAVKMIHGSVSRLRSVLGPQADRLLVTRGNGYQLSIAPDALDVMRCRALLATGLGELPTDPTAAGLLFDEALALFRGTPLGELDGLPFIHAAVAEIEDMRLALVEARIDAALATGRSMEIIGQARRMADEQPLRERPHGQLMLALYRSGRQVEALQVFADFRRRLAIGEGLDPGPELARLQQKILAQDVSLLEPAVPAESSAAEPVVLPSRRQQDPVDDRPLAPRPHRSPSRSRLAFVALVAVGAATTGLLLHRNGSPAKPVTPRPATIAVTGSSAVALDAQSGRIVYDVAVGNQPRAIAFGDGMAWTSNIGDKTISQVDIAAGRVVKTYGLPAAALSLATGTGVVWMTNGFAGTVSRILVDYRQLSAPLLPEERSSGLSVIAVTPTSLWLANADHTVVELDPASLRVVATLHLARQARSIAVTDEAVWSTDIADSLVERTPIATGAPAASFAVRGNARQVVSGSGAVWVTSENPDTLSRIDPGTGHVVKSYQLLGDPSAEAVADGMVWVAEGAAGTLQRFDPSGDVLPTAFNVGHPIGGLTGSDDRVWLTTD